MRSIQDFFDKIRLGISTGTSLPRRELPELYGTMIIRVIYESYFHLCLDHSHIKFLGIFKDDIHSHSIGIGFDGVAF